MNEKSIRQKMTEAMAIVGVFLTGTIVVACLSSPVALPVLRKMFYDQHQAGLASMKGDLGVPYCVIAKVRNADIDLRLACEKQEYVKYGEIRPPVDRFSVTAAEK